MLYTSGYEHYKNRKRPFKNGARKPYASDVSADSSSFPALSTSAAQSFGAMLVNIISDCPFDNVMFSWKGIKGADLKAYITEGHTDEETSSVDEKRTVRRKPDAEIQKWSDELMTYRLKEGGTAWLEGENVRLEHS